MNKVKEVEKYLMTYGKISALEIQQLYYSTCPHSIIRDLRKKHGYNTIEDIWVTKSRKVQEDGSERTETIRYKQYIWKGAA